jgi:monoamine oxidase
VGRIQAGRPGAPPVPIDYGGAWIHGVSTNPLTSLVDRMGFHRARSELDVPFYVDGRQATLEEHERLNEAFEAYELALSAAASRIEYEQAVAEQTCEAGEEIGADQLGAGALCARLGRSVTDDEAAARLCEGAHQVERGTLPPDRFCAQVEEEVRVTSDVAAGYLPREERFAAVLPLLAANAGPLETAVELEASSAVDAEGFEAGEDDLVDRGMGAFVQQYGDGLPVCLRSPVTRIDYGEEGVVVHAGSRQYRGAAALVTVSAGVLRAGKIDFQPPLPRWKREAIDQLPMGHLQKIIIPFEEDIFTGAVDNSWVLVEEDLTPAEQALAARRGMALPDPARRVMAFVLKPLGTNIAIGFYGGRWAQLFEGECAGQERTSGPRSGSGCDDLAIDTAVRALSAIYGEDAVGGAVLADRIHVTRWSLEPYTLGAYSAPLPGGWDQRRVLARPVGTGPEGEGGAVRLFFAGEACSRTIYSGSFPGAFESGLAAAREIHAELLATAGE